MDYVIDAFAIGFALMCGVPVCVCVCACVCIYQMHICIIAAKHGLLITIRNCCCFNIGIQLGTESRRARYVYK